MENIKFDNDINFDCIRDTLIFIQSNLGYEETNPKHHKTLDWSKVFKDEDLLKKYNSDAIRYTIEHLYREGFLETSNSTKGKNDSIINLVITDITFKGHIFLDNIQDETTWNKVKTQADNNNLNVISVLEEYIKVVATRLADKE